MNCWICGLVAETGEHRVKASDLRSMYGHVSQSKPIYLHTDQQRNKVVKGLRSELLKCSALICARCNNERTQPYDRAWEKLSTFFSSSRLELRGGQIIRLDSIFPGTMKRSMLCVHLYFVKLFGCMIAEHEIPINIAPFAYATMNGIAHPKVHVAFGPSLLHRGRAYPGGTDLHTANLDGQCRYATWFYILEKVAANIIYSEPGEHRRSLVHSWHPDTVGKRLRMAAF